MLSNLIVMDPRHGVVVTSRRHSLVVMGREGAAPAVAGVT